MTNKDIEEMVNDMRFAKEYWKPRHRWKVGDQIRLYDHSMDRERGNSLGGYWARVKQLVPEGYMIEIPGVKSYPILVYDEDIRGLMDEVG